MKIISQITKFVLDFSKMIVNALVVTLSVVLNAMQILEKSVDIIRDNDTRPLGS